MLLFDYIGNNQALFFALTGKMTNFVPTQLARCGRAGYLLERTFTDVIFDSQISQNLNYRQEDAATRRPRGMYYIRMGALCPYIRCNMSRRGLTALLILDDGQCESLTVG